MVDLRITALGEDYREEPIQDVRLLELWEQNSKLNFLNFFSLPFFRCNVFFNHLFLFFLVNFHPSNSQKKGFF